MPDALPAPSLPLLQIKNTTAVSGLLRRTASSAWLFEKTGSEWVDVVVLNHRSMAHRNGGCYFDYVLNVT
jgi:hypothetical protein